MVVAEIFVSGFVWGILIGFIISLILIATLKTQFKTRAYRKVLTDMYVIGRLKQYAKDENIDLLGLLREYKQLSKILKEDVMPDKVIEAEISDKITNIGNIKVGE